jgi:hypothetical protein
MFSAHTMTTLEDRARVGVRGGYEPLDEVEAELIELVQYDPDTEEAFAADRDGALRLVSEILGRHVAEHAREEATFPPVTDPDRLTAAFAELDRDGIVARENVGYDMSDVRDEMGELVRARRDARGWVAFHRQDLERVVDGLPLYVAFASRSDAEEDFVAVGREVADRLAAAGLTVDWDGTADARIALLDVAWQRRRPAEPVAAEDPPEEPPRRGFLGRLRGRGGGD